MPRHEDAADDLVVSHLPLARILARRYARRGEPMDELVQVASVGLATAAQRFDPDRGVEFGAFATPFILGALRHHFRDRVGAVRVPRSIREQATLVRATVERLGAELNRSPTTREVARAADLEIEDVLIAMESDRAWAPASLDGSDLDVPAGLDARVDEVEDHDMLRRALAPLDPQERELLRMRYWDALTQAQIAQQLGISQMQVSRLLARAVSHARAALRERP
jgi:RNA polymerase sigma-B factor